MWSVWAGMYYNVTSVILMWQNFTSFYGHHLRSMNLASKGFKIIHWHPIIWTATVLMHPLQIHNVIVLNINITIQLYKLTFALIGYSYRYCVWSSTSIFWDLVNASSERSTATYFICSSEFTFDDSVVAVWRAAVEVRASYDCIRNIVVLIPWFLLERRTTVTIDEFVKTGK